MKITCTQRDLNKGLSIVARAVSARSTLPVLGNVLIEAKGDEVRLAATNLAFSVDCWIFGKVVEEGSITLPAKIFGDMVGKLQGTTVDLELNERTQSVNITSGGFKAKLLGIATEDFPQAHNGAPEQSTELDATMLRTLIDQVAFAASKDDSRPNLRCIHVEFEAQRLTLAATDGYRLARSGSTIGSAGLAQNILIPAFSLAELARILPEADEEQPVTLDVRPNSATFAFAGKGTVRRAEITVQLTAAKYPEYQAIIPRNFVTHATVDKGALLRSFQMAQLFARNDAQTVKLECVSGNDLKVTATDKEMGDSTDVLEAKVTGEAVTMMVNVVFLIEVLNHVDTPQVALELNAATRPLVIRPVGAASQDALHVIMPMNKG